MCRRVRPFQPSKVYPLWSVFMLFFSFISSFISHSLSLIFFLCKQDTSYATHALTQYAKKLLHAFLQCVLTAGNHSLKTLSASFVSISLLPPVVGQGRHRTLPLSINSRIITRQAPSRLTTMGRQSFGIGQGHLCRPVKALPHPMQAQEYSLALNQGLSREREGV